MSFPSQPRRPRRAHEWSGSKIVTFIVTLAATRSVTLAARRSGMSRKSAYALRSRDPAFAEAWEAALGASKARNVEDLKAAPVSSGEGDIRTRATLSTMSKDRRRLDELRRELFFARLSRLHGVSRPLARRVPAQ